MYISRRFFFSTVIVGSITIGIASFYLGSLRLHKSENKNVTQESGIKQSPPIKVHFLEKKTDLDLLVALKYSTKTLRISCAGHSVQHDLHFFTAFGLGLYQFADRDISPYFIYEVPGRGLISQIRSNHNGEPVSLLTMQNKKKNRNWMLFDWFHHWHLIDEKSHEIIAIKYVSPSTNEYPGNIRKTAMKFPLLKNFQYNEGERIFIDAISFIDINTGKESRSINLLRSFLDYGAANNHIKDRTDWFHTNSLSLVGSRAADKLKDKGVASDDIIATAANANLILFLDRKSGRIKHHLVGPGVRPYSIIVNHDGNLVYVDIDTSDSSKMNIIEIDPASGTVLGRRENFPGAVNVGWGRLKEASPRQVSDCLPRCHS